MSTDDPSGDSSANRAVSPAPMLEGVRVLDITQYLAGPTVTRMMAELGADIIKVEQAPGGDPSRQLAIVKDGRSGYFVQQNRGKKSLCVDFRSEQGLDIVRRLASEVDVVVENTGPGVLEKRSLDYASIRAANPAVVMVSISAFGQTGPLSNRVGYDLIAQAFSGIMHVTGDADGPPQFVGSGIGDVTAGVHGLAALGLALFHRERTGVGQHLDISMIDALFHQHELAVQAPPLTGGKWRVRRNGHHAKVNAPHGTFRGPEGWIVILVLDRQWPNMVAALGQPELADDERFCDIRVRAKNAAALVSIIETWMAGFSTDDAVLRELEHHRVPAAPVLDPAEAANHDYFIERDMVRSVPDPLLGTVSIPGSPLRFSEYPEPLELVAPTLGEHNEEILRGLGYSVSEIASLDEAGAIRRGDT